MSAANVSERTDAHRQVVAELQGWRAAAIPGDPPLGAEDVARLVRALFDALGIDAAVGAELSVNTVHYYRRKDILDAPVGRTSAARYAVRHVWQAAGARLAGALGLVTLAEARRVMRNADESALVAFVASRVLDARARDRLRLAARPLPPGRPGESTLREAPVMAARPLPGVLSASPPEIPGVISLPGEAWCILPASHPARHSSTAARALVHALADALGVTAR